MMTDLASTTPQSLGRDSMVGLRLARVDGFEPAVSYTHLRAHETG